MAHETSPARTRISNACDICKARKVKCDGNSPCRYCRRRHLICHYSPRRRRNANTPSSRLLSLNNEGSSATGNGLAHYTQCNSPPTSLDRELRSPTNVDPSGEEETDVPREARLHKDSQGKLVFIGDCAPLSFYQSVWQLVTSRVDAAAFAQPTSQPSVLQNFRNKHASNKTGHPPSISLRAVDKQVVMYLAATAGFVDLFNDAPLLDAVTSWAASKETGTVVSPVYYLVLAIGAQAYDESSAEDYFAYGKEQAFISLGGDLSIETVQAFILITIYLLVACQTNAAFIFFGIAARSAFALGIHRREANALFGDCIGRQRDRIWKSLRVVDLFLSTSMGRPPATSDVDCTVLYRMVDDNGNEVFDLLNASVQILLITEAIVVEVYSRRKISLATAEGISGRLREWSARWVKQLQELLFSNTSSNDAARVNGACQILATYYYAVMLVSRPFLMYQLCKELSDETSVPPATKPDHLSGKSKLADACIDAAILMVTTVKDLLDRHMIKGRMPMLVPWLFACSLVLGLGLLGGSSRILEKYARMSVSAIEHFAKGDTYATQYSLITNSLVTISLRYVEKLEMHERRKRTESSSQLFGLTLHANDDHTRSEQLQSASVNLTDGYATSPKTSTTYSEFETNRLPYQHNDNGLPLEASASLTQSPDLSIFDGLFEGMSDRDWAGMNLFPVLEEGSQPDLANFS